MSRSGFDAPQIEQSAAMTDDTTPPSQPTDPDRGGALEPAQAMSTAFSEPAIADLASAVQATTTAPGQNVSVNHVGASPAFLVRVIWYLLFGWWLTGFAIVFAWGCAVTVILLPISFWIINQIPFLLTLRTRSTSTSTQVDAQGNVLVTTQRAEQRDFAVRAIYFVLVGWWATGLAMAVAYAMCLTILLIPFGLMLFNRLPAVMTLQRN